MKPISEVIREKEAEIQHLHDEIEALKREKELRVKSIESELETLRAAARIISGEGGGQAHGMAAAAAPVPTLVPAQSAAVENFPVQSVPPAPEPARKRWP